MVDVTERKRGGGRRAQLRYVVLLAVALALSAVLAACEREANPTSDEPEVTVLAPTPSATVAPATFTPEPTAPPPTPTQVPQAVEEPPPFPTPDIDLTDYSIYGETLLEAFAEDAGRLPDAPHYFIQVRLLPGEVPSLEGVQRVRITNQEETSLTELYFRLYPNLPAYGGAAEVSRALVDGKAATVGDLFDGTAVFIPLEGGLSPGATTDVTLWFRATLPTQVNAGTAGAGLYGFVEGVYDLAGFYPTLAVYDHRGWDLDAGARFGDSLFADSGYYQVELTVPEALTVVASGSTVAREPNDDRTTLWRIAAGPVRSFYAAVTDRWEAISEEVDGITVNSYYPVGGLASAQTALGHTTGSLAVFNRMFGHYPYRELDVVPLPTTAFGMEHAGLLALAASFYTEAGGGFGIATPHEVAHQWFFNLIGNDQPDEPWLDESVANYAVYLYYEAVDWPQMQTALLENVFRYRYDAARNLGIDRPVSGAVAGFDQSNYINIIYSKGPLFLHAVRERIGDEAFFAALLDYVQSYRYGIAYAEDLLDVFRRHSGTPIDDLIAFWIYGE
ncbi:MAG: M1 family metallopeptidase [Caldilineaceae bacterium SB0661_bin_32]|uniref:M1 family metallopeptidase n=1 Tax=Caldilineaceae bacterium SB0661_bin_32 TaxID=2605255 RepID=A0A6B1D5L0_9CHLR|nr:M1 family metallopeptidase [Caldilineaceae bacterium SB0661_bin_32]